ncbi:hypothetical protein MMC27_001759 [Xylographa pallens]|nr:hypothetical protein [Xylographa pallens]
MTEFVVAERSKGEVLLFGRGQHSQLQSNDEEKLDNFDSRGVVPAIPSGKRLLAPTELSAATFLWSNLSYEIKTKEGPLMILDDVEGWMRPGSLTALMGASGAGKTTLLNVLANRASIGVIGGEIIIDAIYQGESFARKVGYAQQQDLHLSTATVREALTFSALLRQPQRYSKAQKLAYVEEVIETLEMTAFADAVVGVPGQGLNVEQRKRVTIGVELAARPELLLFLDEPTSGMDSNTAWSICTLLRKLADQGQPILCTIHQPSGTLFQMFDRLLFLVKGRSAYFGDIGLNSKVLIDYFQHHGARACGIEENPAEWLLDITGNSPGSTNTIDWPEKWEKSPQRRDIKSAIKTMQETLSRSTDITETKSSQSFAVSFIQQLYIVTRRNFEHDWRSPSYLYSKIFLTLGIGLVNGFSFYNSLPDLQGVQNQLFSVYLLSMLFSNVVQLIMPRFLDNRTLYELRERPSRTYSWTVFILSNILSEIPAQSVMAILLFITWYFPLGMYRHTLVSGPDAVGRGALVLGLLWCYTLFCSTFSQMLATIMPDAATGVNVASLLYSLALIFCGILVPYASIPPFWRFMYRVSPITYSVSAILATGISTIPITCAPSELLTFDPPAPLTCAQYLASYLATAGGSVLNPNATAGCSLCPVSSTDEVLLRLGIRYEDRWWMFGVGWVYVAANVLGALGLYWVARCPKRRVGRKAEGNARPS